MAGSIEVRAPNQKKERRWKLEKKKIAGSGELVQMNTVAFKATQVLVLGTSCTCPLLPSVLGQLRSRLTLLQRQQALEFCHQQGHTQHNPLPLSFKLPKQAFPPLEACISSKTSGKVTQTYTISINLLPLWLLP